MYLRDISSREYTLDTCTWRNRTCSCHWNCSMRGLDSRGTEPTIQVHYDRIYPIRPVKNTKSLEIFVAAVDR
jgi:hypothetical protein